MKDSFKPHDMILLSNDLTRLIQIHTYTYTIVRAEP